MKENYKKAILQALGNPTTGPIVDYLDVIVDAVVGLESKGAFKPNATDGDGDGFVQDGTAYERPAKETRVVETKNKR